MTKQLIMGDDPASNHERQGVAKQVIMGDGQASNHGGDQGDKEGCLL